MFCPNCGTNNDQGTVFCENCGVRLAQASEPVSRPQPSAPQQPTPPSEPYPGHAYPAPAPKKSKVPMIIGVVVLLIAVAVGCWFAFGDSTDKNSKSTSVSEANETAKAAAITFVEGLVENDPDKALSAVYPEMEDIEAEIESQCESIRSDAEENNISFDHVYVDEMGDDSEEIEDAEYYMSNSYGTDVTIDELMLVEVAVDRSSGGDSDTMTVDVYVAKIDGYWYVIRTN